MGAPVEIGVEGALRLTPGILVIELEDRKEEVPSSISKIRSSRLRTVVATSEKDSRSSKFSIHLVMFGKLISETFIPT